MRFDTRQIASGLFIAGVMGALLFLPAMSFVGQMLAPSQPVPGHAPVPPLLRDALWARANGGRAADLQPFNPFTIGRMASCHMWAERHEDRAARDHAHDDCMQLMPGIEALAHVSSAHMRADGVWQDVRVPFVQLSMLTRMSSTWTKADLLSTLAERGEFGYGFVGAEAAAQGYFARTAAALTLPQAALVGAFVGSEQSPDPWCFPAAATRARQRVLERMRDNQAIDEAAFHAADLSDLDLAAPPATHTPCQQ